MDVGVVFGCAPFPVGSRGLYRREFLQRCRCGICVSEGVRGPSCEEG
jgi:hypothetical protein